MYMVKLRYPPERVEEAHYAIPLGASLASIDCAADGGRHNLLTVIVFLALCVVFSLECLGLCSDTVQQKLSPCAGRVTQALAD
jgi:hypothetical protein